MNTKIVPWHRLASKIYRENEKKRRMNSRDNAAETPSVKDTAASPEAETSVADK